jgi:FdhD protein
MSIVRRTLPDGSQDDLIREEPLQIAAGGGEVLTMRTPGDDEHLALGFLLSEGVLDRVAQVRAVRAVPGIRAQLQPDRIEVDLAGVDASRLRGRLTRTHEIRASCGACGLTDVDALLEGIKPCLPGVPRMSLALLHTLRADFEARQVAFQRTGACHGAAIYDEHGALHGFGEDVGRHNALDKAIGRAARAGTNFQRAIALLSGRAGYDLVLKCLRLGMPAILSLSAPSALGFELCHAAGCTLVGFLRADRCKVYSGAGRLVDA